MTVQSSDLRAYKSAGASSAGGAISAAQIVSGTLNNLFADISPAEATAGGTQTRKWFLTNGHATDSLEAFATWISTVPTQTTEEIGVGWDTADDADAAQGLMTAFGANAVASVESSAADTRTVIVVGLDINGDPLEQTLTLTGTTPVLSVPLYSKVYSAKVSATHGTNTVTVKQGSAGTTRGTIGPNKIQCFLWVSAVSLATGIKRKLLAAGSSYGWWDRLTWSPGATEVNPDSSVAALQRV